MGHLAAKDVYRDLGRKLDGLATRAPWNETLRAILSALYTPEEADLVARMPSGLASLDRIAEVTGLERARLRSLLERLADKGLVMDLCLGEEWRYSISPLVVGVFEFTMMRAGAEADHTKVAPLFHEYLSDRIWFQGNYGAGQEIGIMRSIPHAGTVADEDVVEVLDYEKAEAIVESADRFSMGICSCRHEKEHAGAAPPAP